MTFALMQISLDWKSCVRSTAKHFGSLDRLELVLWRRARRGPELLDASLDVRKLALDGLNRIGGIDAEDGVQSCERFAPVPEQISESTRFFVFTKSATISSIARDIAAVSSNAVAAARVTEPSEKLTLVRAH
jgi:hypothetical protein